MFAAPPPTPYDLQFRIGRVPVRVHPGFWIAGLFFGFDETDVKFTLMSVAVLFVSILVHEFGHAGAGLAFGDRPWVVLHWLGGLCLGADGRSRLERALIILAGPAAGLLLAALSVLAFAWHYGVSVPDSWAWLSGFGEVSPRALVAIADRLDGYTLTIFRVFFFVNFWWSLVNLLPVWPLDGGQFLATVLGESSSGMRTAHIVSIVTAGAAALWLYQLDQRFNALLFLALLVTNVLSLKQLNQAGSADSAAYGRDPADWWKG